MTDSGPIYHLSVPEGYEWALPVDSDDFEVLQGLAERHPRGTWRPIQMTLLTTDDWGRPQRRADLPWLGSHDLVLRDEAIDTVGSLLAPHGELLPLACEQARLAVFSAPAVAGVLDEERSDIVRFGSGRIMAIRHPVFRRDVLGASKAFKLAEMPRGELYLAEDIVDEIRATGMISGTKFKLADGGRDGPSPPASRLDLALLTGTRLVWRPDPRYRFWLVADFGKSPIHMRINPKFPDVPLYSLPVDADETYDFDDLPELWSREGRLEWQNLGSQDS